MPATMKNTEDGYYTNSAVEGVYAGGKVLECEALLSGAMEQRSFSSRLPATMIQASYGTVPSISTEA